MLREHLKFFVFRISPPLRRGALREDPSNGFVRDFIMKVKIDYCDDQSSLSSITAVQI